MALKLDENYNGSTLLSEWWQSVKNNFTVLASAIEQEISDRGDAVMAEKLERAAAIAEAVSEEKSEREAADATEKSEREAAVAAEQHAREIEIAEERSQREALAEDVGDIQTLTTSDRSSVVNAINSLKNMISAISVSKSGLNVLTDYGVEYAQENSVTNVYAQGVPDNMPMGVYVFTPEQDVNNIFLVSADGEEELAGYSGELCGGNTYLLEFTGGSGRVIAEFENSGEELEVIKTAIAEIDEELAVIKDDVTDITDWLEKTDVAVRVMENDYLKSADKAEINESVAEVKNVADAALDQAQMNAETIAELSDKITANASVAPEFANSVDECSDTSKLYVLPDGYIYAYMETAILSGGYTNLLDTAAVTINSRTNSSGVIKDCAGYITVSNIPVANGDVVRIKPGRVVQGNSTTGNDYTRLHVYDSSGTRLNSDLNFIDAYPDCIENDIATATIAYDTAASMTLNLRVCEGDSDVAITESDLDGLVVTVNEEIVEPAETVGYAWANTGHAFVPADYEDRILELEGAAEKTGEAVAELQEGLEAVKENAVSPILLGGMSVFAPSPQLPADGSDTADFDAETVTAEEIYEYIDVLAEKYPNYITKEVMGKDMTGVHDWCRYTLCRRYYDAWQKVNYPKLYAWVNGNTVVYSESVSPRIGDVVYSTAYIGTEYGTVEAVDNANQARTIGGVVFTRDNTQDVEPTLVYTQTYYNPYYVGAYADFRNSVYNSEKTVISTIDTYSTDSMTDADGVAYIRYPLGDRDNTFTKPKVIVIGANEHGRQGDPAEPAIISARMIKDLCECKNASNPFINLLKNNYMMIFTPVINPYGLSVSDGGYYNGNSVNLDRNFDTPGWGLETSTVAVAGEYGGSENETQYFMNTISESGAAVVTANHALGHQINADTGEATNAGMCHWMLGENKSAYVTYLNGIGESMSANYNLSFTDYGQAPPEDYAKTRSYIAWSGAKGGAVEMQARDGFVLAGEGELHTAAVIEADYTLLLQFLHMLVMDAENLI